MPPAAAPTEDTTVLDSPSSLAEEFPAPAPTWSTVLWNDEVNDGFFVILTLQRLLEIPREKAIELVTAVETHGRASVLEDDLPKVTEVATALQAAGLWGTVERQR